MKFSGTPRSSWASLEFRKPAAYSGGKGSIAEFAMSNWFLCCFLSVCATTFPLWPFGLSSLLFWGMVVDYDGLAQEDLHP